MLLHRFYFESMTRARVKQERYGQALFNHLLEVRPDLAEKVRGTNLDPFYLTGPAANPERWDAFCTFIEGDWHKGKS